MSEFPQFPEEYMMIFQFIKGNNETIALLIPILLQLIGIFGWIWEGYQIYRNRRWKYHLSGMLRSTIVWSVGIILEIIIITIL